MSRGILPQTTTRDPLRPPRRRRRLCLLSTIDMYYTGRIIVLVRWGFVTFVYKYPVKNPRGVLDLWKSSTLHVAQNETMSLL